MLQEVEHVLSVIPCDNVTLFQLLFQTLTRAQPRDSAVGLPPPDHLTQLDTSAIKSFKTLWTRGTKQNALVVPLVDVGADVSRLV